MLRIYLTDLAAYNKGFLIGEWIDLPCDDLQSKLSKILASGEALCFMETGCYEKHEEWFITDYEWEEVDLFSIDEYEDIFKLNEMLFRLQDLDKDDQLKIIKFLLSQGIANDVDNAIAKKDDVIIYSNSSMRSVAYDMLNDCYNLDNLPTIITNYIDYDAIGNDLLLEGRYFQVDDDIYEYLA